MHRMRLRRFTSSIPPGTPFPLTDRFRRTHDYLRVSLTERCNLRCTYCMPETGVALTPKAGLLDTEELCRVVEIFVKRCGVTKVRFTGGEPTLRKDLCDVVSRVKDLGVRHIGITTNGLLLHRLAGELSRAGVTQVNVSLDTLDAVRFERITRRLGHGKVVKGIHTALGLVGKGGFEKVKINCVVKRNVNDDELALFVAWTKSTPLEIRFLEYMPFQTNGWDETDMVTYAEMLEIIKSGGFPDLAPASDEPNPTAKMWQVPGHVGRIGFITAMTDDFCSSCNRIRLTADGNVKACLFGEQEVSLTQTLRDGLKTDDDVIDLINKSVQGKHERLGGHENPRSISKGVNRPMITIGG